MERESGKQVIARGRDSGSAIRDGRVLVVLESADVDPEDSASEDARNSAGLVDDVVEFPARGNARVEVSPGAKIQWLTATGSDADFTTLGDDSTRAAVGLYLRVGRVKARAVATEFTVRTPVLALTGDRGSVFTVRVVLDAATTVGVVKGAVEALSKDGEWVARLRQGQRLYVDGAGEV
jgi:hypothetical protein